MAESISPELTTLLASVPLDPHTVHGRLKEGGTLYDELLGVAIGEIAVEDPSWRQKALTALEWDAPREPQALIALRQVIDSRDDSRLRIQAARALARAGRAADLAHLQRVVRNPRERLEVALAAARGLARRGRRDVIPDLRRFRRRLLRRAGGDHLPSLRSLADAVERMRRA